MNERIKFREVSSRFLSQSSPKWTPSEKMSLWWRWSPSELCVSVCVCGCVCWLLRRTACFWPVLWDWVSFLFSGFEDAKLSHTHSFFFFFFLLFQNWIHAKTHTLFFTLLPLHISNTLTLSLRSLSPSLCLSLRF